MIIIPFTKPSKTRNSVSVYFYNLQNHPTGGGIFYFDGFSKAASYPWFRELLKLAIG